MFELTSLLPRERANIRTPAQIQTTRHIMAKQKLNKEKFLEYFISKNSTSNNEKSISARSGTNARRNERTELLNYSV